MEQNTNKVGKHSAPQQVQGESFFRRLLKKPGVQSFLAALLCIVIGLVVGYIVLLAIEPSGASKAIGAVLKNFLARRSSALRMKQFANTLVKTAPLIMCSLSILFAYKTGLFNIGAAGQYVLGAGAALYCALGLELPWYVCLLAAAAAGALLGCISGALKAYCNVNEVISCIMLNWISLYAVNSVLKDFCPVGYKDTFTLVSRNSSALLPSLGLNKVFGSESATIAIPMAVIIAVIIWVVLEKTKFGYEIKATGLNRNAAKYCGMREKRNIILTMLIAGALAGIAAAMMFLSGFMEWDINQSSVPAMGFNGIAAAFLGGLNPIGAIFSSYFIQHITDGGSSLDTRLYPPQISDLISSLIIYLCGFVLYFRLLAAGCGALLPQPWAALPAMLLEVCSGCDQAARTGLWASTLCCAALSVQGVSVLLQVRTICPAEISLRPLLAARAVHLPLSVALFWLGSTVPVQAVQTFTTLTERVVVLRRVPLDCALLAFAVCCITVEELAR